MKKIVIFRVGEKQFGLDLPMVRHIQKAGVLFDTQKHTDIDNNMLVLEGEQMPFYDLSVIISGEKSKKESDSKVILLKTTTKSLAVKVDRIDGVIEVESDRIEPLPPIMNKTAMTWFPSVLKQGTNLILMLNPDGIEYDNKEFSDFPQESPTPERKEAKELEDVLTRMLTEKMMPNLFEQVIPRIIEKAVNRSMKKVKKVLKDNLCSV